MNFIVVKRGVYRHDIRGVWGFPGAAIDFAVEWAKAEPDDYHTFQVVCLDFHGKKEEKLIATIKRKDRGKSIFPEVTIEYAKS